ncbi:hypothetical protein [Wohlfahrtiimonas larvae]|uniref:Uncharacterized protein n=1 Tax=Wohlfahrtiimonas larvae TaxID=1157986 RepID=A0ABP9MRJ1_9GAMM|nr:hypothetical protein [Wohlfahrtiimonas larvae]
MKKPSFLTLPEKIMLLAIVVITITLMFYSHVEQSKYTKLISNVQHCYKEDHKNDPIATKIKNRNNTHKS